ncbi:MAG: glycosyl transferase family 2 [Candidatus Schekmanbacteria bacterium RBG_16_38_10]|uniref:Glycosyl transferase family 2 n=1 Tax=Candidatus Schekmanbacteria bacterium RBG_16_38_10 TaxID=1817879 RepID=A0A1F7RR23_9BACT|nr:MAG: glycosyl transferase family 2 [Candidatus Schekmanbacteria bacterium RBG_16_38_10]
MELVVLILKSYLVFVVGVMILYTARHFIFTVNRFMGEQMLYYQDIVDSELPRIAVLIPMHNEELVAKHILDHLISADYPLDKTEIIPINDHSEDRTKEIVDEYAARYKHIKPLHRHSDRRGKPAALNEAMTLTDAEIIVVFDADYLPAKGTLRDIAISFKDPEIGAVMGRVVPENTSKNLLTRVLDLERSGGYQVDQQARYNLKLLPQYGGTVGGFRKKVVLDLGGFDPNMLTEDTELTYKLFVNGWKVVYANRVEAYEESPEDWNVRSRQIRRWARGHTQVMFKFILPVLKSEHLVMKEKIDGLFLLFVYSASPILFLGLCDSLILFFLGEMKILSSLLMFLFVASFNTLGNFAPFFQIGIASFIDGGTYRIRLLPLLIFNFFFNMLYMSMGFFEAIIDLITKRESKWDKTTRFRAKDKKN